MKRLIRIVAALMSSDALVPLATVAVGAGLAYLTGQHKILTAELGWMAERRGQLAADIEAYEARLQDAAEAKTPDDWGAAALEDATRTRLAAQIDPLSAEANPETAAGAFGAAAAPTAAEIADDWAAVARG